MRVLDREPVLRGPRVCLFPLSAEDLALWLRDPSTLTDSVGARIAMGKPERLMMKVFERKIESIRACPGQLLWYTYWAILLHDPQPVVVGLLGFKGFDRRRRQAEVGYGIEPSYRRQGLMTESLKLLLAWARREVQGISIVARTDEGNHPSIRVLRRCDFALDRREGKQIVWVSRAAADDSLRVV